MAKPNPEVDAYIAEQPEKLQPLLRELRELIRAAFPKATETMYEPGAQALQATNFPMYTQDGETVVSFAGRSVGARLYIDADIMAQYADQLGSLVQGKVCVLYKPNKSLDHAALRELFRTMINESAAKHK